MACVSCLRASCRSEMSCCPRRSRWKTAKVARSRWPDDSFRTLSRFGEAGFLAEPRRRVDRTCEVISERCERELASVVFRRRNQGEPPHDKTESINGWLVDRWHRFERWHHPAIDVLATGYRPLASCSRERLERSDFVLWPEAAAFSRCEPHRSRLGSAGANAAIVRKPAPDPTRTSSSFEQHGCEGIIGRAFGLRRQRPRFRHRMNSMISRVQPNCRFGDSRRWACGKCNAADCEHCQGEKSASRFVNGHFGSP